MSREELIALLREHKDELYRRFGIKHLALFGSYARNEANDSSDVDLAILEMERSDLWKMAGAIGYLRDVLKKEVDLGKFDHFRPFVRKYVEKELVDVF